MVTPYHHGISVTDLAAWRAAIRPLGFTKTEPGADEPRHYANVQGDGVGQMIAGWLGEEISTHYVENPETGQQLDLVEIAARSLCARPSWRPAQGDITAGIPAREPAAAYAAMRAAAPSLAFSDPCSVAEEDGLSFTVDGQAIVLSRATEPFTIVHYSTAGWPAARRFIEDVLGFGCTPLGEDGAGWERYRVESAAGRVEVSVSPETVVAPPSAGKKYPGANHFRLVGADLPAIVERVAASGQGSWLFTPAPGADFGQIYGPSAEFIELYGVTA